MTRKLLLIFTITCLFAACSYLPEPVSAPTGVIINENRDDTELVSAGSRYTIKPVYKAFSNIYSYIDLPLRIRWVGSFKRES